jgi:hypothetical protein
MHVIVAACGGALVADVVHLVVWPQAWLWPVGGVGLAGFTLAGALHSLRALNRREARR